MPTRATRGETAPLRGSPEAPTRGRGALTLLSALLTLIAGACSKAEPTRAWHEGREIETLELRYQGSPGSVSPPELAEDLGYLAPIRLVHVGDVLGGPQSIQAVVTGDTDFGSAFNGAIIKLIAAKAPLRSVLGSYGVSEQFWSGFYVLDDSPIRGARDLIGKKISMNTLGAHSEFMTKEYLFRNGLGAEARQVTLVVIPPVNGEQALRQKQVEVAILGNVYRDRALERGGVRAIATDYELFGAFTAGSYVMSTKFIEEHPNATRKFVEATAKAIAWTQTTPREEVLARFASILRKRNRNEDDSILKYWRSYGVAGKGGVLDDRDFQIWIDWLIRDGELRPGQVNARDLYTNDLNPYASGKPPHDRGQTPAATP
ncbi:ABC transporter substrate-binding protein [Sorangium sp. So ce394]|uniref:ABC transporter substrate-binding protein n=1 Tax=Sorangium sp. So ce394 TaxID=3133310 RepID=UPI003F5C60DA